MLDIKYIREHAKEVKENCLRRRVDVDVDLFLELDKQRLALLQKREEENRKSNEFTKKIGKAIRSANEEEKKELLVRAKKYKEAEEIIKDIDDVNIMQPWRDLLFQIPNLTHPDVPRGESDRENKEIKVVGKVVKPKFEPKSHVELAKEHDLIDFERGAKVAGAKFYFLKGKLAILEQALIRYGMDFAMREGFTLLITPDLAKEEILVGKGFLPRGPEKQVYYVEGEDLALIGTAEITVLGLHADEIIPEEALPKKYVAFSHCFRKEAGTYGRESYGLYRVHQFSKVEMFAFAAPDQSEALHLEFLRLEELFWKSLEIPFRVVDCCTGDLGGADYRRYDLEAWMWGKGSPPAGGGVGGGGSGRGGWGEVTSASNCLDFQSHGLNIKFLKDEKKEFVHTLNGTVVATPRALLSILENHQQADGSIVIPQVLRPYCGFDRIG